MIGDYLKVCFLVLTASSLASCHCPVDRIHSIGYCVFRIECIGNITGISLPEDCRGSVNHPVSVELTLYNADDRFEDYFDPEFVAAVTMFRVTASWPETNLTFLSSMPKLQSLELSNSQIKTIDGDPFLYTNYLEHLDLSHNYLTDISLFYFDNEQNKLKRLILSNNHIECVPGDAFSELTNLIELDLSHNRITDLNEEPFNNLTSLEILRLNGNVIKDLNGAIKDLVSLKHLYLENNEIQNFDKHYLKINHLETFDVSGNQLETFTPNMFLRHWDYITGVCKIILSDNELTSILDTPVPKIVSSRSARDIEDSKVNLVTEVDLSKNHINKIEYNAFQSIIRMTSLDVSSNNLTIFIVNPRDLKDVRYLNLSCNYIAHLYHASFSSMVNLQNLDLSHNKVDSISREAFTQNYNLKHVNLTYNNMHALKSIQVTMFHTEGGVLDLSNNGLSSLSIPSGEALHLKVLVLNSNNIVDAATINVYYQNELKTLEIKNNTIEKLNDTSLMLPLGLNFLDLSVNRIKDIGPSTFHKVSHLKSLFLGHNKLKRIQFGAFQGLTSLMHLDLSFNELQYLDSKVLWDLKSLSVLSLRSNGFSNLDYKAWLNHAHVLRVYVENNDYSCEWLSKALSDFNNGYSRMRPTVRQFTSIPSKNSIEGIPCLEFGTNEPLNDPRSNVLADDRLLVTNRRILEAVKDQTNLLKTLINSLHKTSN